MDDVTEQKTNDVAYYWIARCNGGGDVVFPRMIQKGDGIYYSEYIENEDTTTVHGYIKSIEEILP